MLEPQESKSTFDPTKPPTATKSALDKAVETITAERAAQAEEKATAIYREAIELCEKREKARKQFASADAKFDKELGKILGRLGGGGGEGGQGGPSEETPAAE